MCMEIIRDVTDVFTNYWCVGLQPKKYEPTNLDRFILLPERFFSRWKATAPNPATSCERQEIFVNIVLYKFDILTDCNSDILTMLSSENKISFTAIWSVSQRSQSRDLSSVKSNRIKLH